MTRYLSHNLKLGPATPSALRRRVRRVRLDRRARAPTRVPHHRRAHRGVAPQGWFPLYFLSFRLSLSFSYFFYTPAPLPILNFRARFASRAGWTEPTWGGPMGWQRGLGSSPSPSPWPGSHACTWVSTSSSCTIFFACEAPPLTHTHKHTTS